MAAVDSSIIMGGVAPNSGEVIRQAGADQRANTLAQASVDTSAAGLKASATELASKQNILATQMLSAAAGTGDQSVWDKTKEGLAQHGVDVSAVPADVNQGKDWATAAKLSQSPLGPIIDAASKQDANVIAANTAQGKATTDPNATIHSLYRGAVTSQLGPAAGAAFDQHYGTPQAPAAPQDAPMTPAAASTVSGLFDPGAQPAATQPNPTQAPAAVTTPDPQAAKNVQATVNTIQQHYASLAPQDQQRLQSVSQGAAQLMPFLQKGDTQGAMNFLQQRKQQLVQQGDTVDTQDTDAAIQLLQSGQVDQLKQQVNAILAYGTAVNAGGGQGSAQTQAATPATAPGAPKFTPPAADPSKTQAANQQAYQEALEAYNADPAVKAANAQAEAAAGAKGKDQGAQPLKAASSEETYNRVVQNIDGMLSINDKVPDAGKLLSPSQQAAIDQRTGKLPLVGDNNAASDAYNSFTKVNKAQVLSGLQELLQSTNDIRSSRQLIGLIDQVNGIDVDASVDSRAQQLNAVKAELANWRTSAHNVDAKVNGGASQPYQAIPMSTPAMNTANIPAQLGAVASSAPTGFSIKRIK